MSDYDDEDDKHLDDVIHELSETAQLLHKGLDKFRLICFDFQSLGGLEATEYNSFKEFFKSINILPKYFKVYYKLMQVAKVELVLDISPGKMKLSPLLEMPLKKQDIWQDAWDIAKQSAMDCGKKHPTAKQVKAAVKQAHSATKDDSQNTTNDSKIDNDDIRDITLEMEKDIAKLLKTYKKSSKLLMNICKKTKPDFLFDCQIFMKKYHGYSKNIISILENWEE